MNRRDFIKLSLFSPMVKVGTGLAVSSAMVSAKAAPSNGYKALVVLMLDGGNDAMNMFIPTDSTPHQHYFNIRTSSDTETENIGIAIANLDDSSGTSSRFTTDTNGHYIKNAGSNHPYFDAVQQGDGLETSAIRSYRKGCYHTTQGATNQSAGLGINAMMPEFAAMYKEGKLSLVSNVGTLIKPTTQAQINNDSAELPVFLFAHNHQQRAVWTAQAEKLAKTGWAGRIADAWSVNAPVGLNISYWDKNLSMVGESTSPLKMPTGDTVAFNTKHIIGAFTKGDKFEKVLERFNKEGIARNNAFSQYYSQQIKKAGELSILLTDAMQSAPDFSTFTAKNSYGQPLFTIPDMANDFKLIMHDATKEGIFEQLEACAKMIKVGKDTLGYNRQIFYVRMPGFDTHTNQSSGHADLLRSLSVALSDFQKALEEMGVDDKVLTVSLSEFGRTLLNSGNGSGHGWGGHSFMISGDPTFNGGNVFGTVLDDLRLDGINTHTAKGRIIPTTSVEQMLAPALKWFGVENELMTTILPNLNHFKIDENNAESAFLQNVFS